MLDQLLAASGGHVTEANVRDLLGLADADAVEALVAALADGDAAAGIAVLDDLEDRGRDLGVVLDQAVDLVRTQLAASFATDDPASAARLTRAARSLASIDPERRGVGGMRLQVELALFATPAAPSVQAERPAKAAAPRASATPPPAAEPTPVPAAPTAGPSAAAPAEPPAPEPEPPAAAPEPKPEPEQPSVETAQPAAEPAAPPVAAAGSDLDRLLTSWPEIVNSVRPATRAVITECRPMSVDGNVVTLGFPEAKAFLKDVAERKRADLEAAVGGFLGRSVNVRCVATNIDLVPMASGSDDESGRIFAEAKRIFEDDLVDVGEVS
jgi:DNA polymerase III gamma/tau subunit